MQKLLQLFWTFLKINLLTTSGPASAALLHAEAVGKFMTEEQFIEAVGFSSAFLVPMRCNWRCSSGTTPVACLAHWWPVLPPHCRRP
jgi:hypothetical protein